ncbi:MAG: carboxypeptidase regulatory-like domain-containing protein [Gemmatimonadota bacterium]
MRPIRATMQALGGLLAWLPLASAQAQVLVTGTVRDSLTGVPFAGAVVDLVPTGTPWLAGYSARTDSLGRFSVAQVDAGTYHFGFQHPRLDSLGMDPVVRTLDVRASRARITADLALPTARTFARTLCRARADNSGLLLGRVLDARDGSVIRSGTVLIRWGELSVGADGVRNDQAQRTATVRDDGRFIACGVPTDGPIEVQAVAGTLTDPSWVQPRITSGIVELTFDYDTPLRHRDLFVAPELRDSVPTEPALDSARHGAATVRRGAGRVAGRVIDDDGRPVRGARMVVREAGAESVTDSSGAFRLTRLPLGTQTVEMIGLGLVPMRTAVDVMSGAEASVVFRATKRVATLDEVTVRTNRDLTGFARRKRTSSGTFLTAADIERKGAFSVGEALINVPGLRYLGIDPTTNKPAIGGRFGCGPRFYLDGLRVSLADIDGMLGIKQIGAIEVYANSSEAPPQYTGPAFASGATKNLAAQCASVVVWTKAQVP